MTVSSVRLSNSVIDRAEPRKRTRYLWDRDLKGFGLRITASGAKSFIVQYRLWSGRTRRQTLGRFRSPLTADEARHHAKALLLQVAQGEDPKAPAEMEEMTFAELAERYIAEHSRPKKKPASCEEDRRNLRLHLLPVFGKKNVREIGARDIARFHAGRSDHSHNANRCLALLSHIFTLARHWGVVAGDNPCQAIKKYPERPRERYLSPEELKRLGEALARAEGQAPWQAVSLIRLLLLTGARRGELENLTWSEVRLDIPALFLSDSKTGAKRIPLSRQAVALLRQLPRIGESKFVFPAERGEGRFVGLPKIWRAIRTEADIEDVRLHDLRHSFASFAASNGVPLRVLGQILGHRDTRTTQRYAHLFEDPVREATESVSELMSDALSAPAKGPARLRLVSDRDKAS